MMVYNVGISWDGGKVNDIYLSVVKAIVDEKGGP